MSDLVELREIRLTPVIKLEQWLFEKESQETSKGPFNEMHDESLESWKGALADLGIVDLYPIVAGSLNVMIDDLSDSQLETILSVAIENWGGVSCLNDPENEVFLPGGLALCSGDRKCLVEPTCCGDLRDIGEWQKAVEYRGNDWATLWIGHPWLSMKYQEPWLVVSDLHDSGVPVERWRIRQDVLGEAVRNAYDELVRFSFRIDSVIRRCDGLKNAAHISRCLAGVDSECEKA